MNSDTLRDWLRAFADNDVVAEWLDAYDEFDNEDGLVDDTDILVEMVKDLAAENDGRYRVPAIATLTAWRTLDGRDEGK